MAPFRHSLEALANPFFLCLLAYIFAFIAVCTNYHRQKLEMIMAVILVVLLILSTGWFPSWLTARLENHYAFVDDVNPDIHYVVVLSGGQASGLDLPPNTLLYSASIKRLVEGLRLYRALPDATLILSGGGYGGDRPESQQLKEIAKWFSIPENQIQLESLSVNTSDQIKALKNLVKDQPFYLVTSAIHLPRAMALCKKQGLKAIAAPTDFTLYWHDERWQKKWIPNAQNIVYFNIAFHEILGSFWGKISGEQ